MSRIMFVAGAILFVLPFVLTTAALSDEGAASPAETVQRDEPAVRRTEAVPGTGEAVRTVPGRAVPIHTVPVRVELKPVRVKSQTVYIPTVHQVGDQIQMDLLVVELRGNVQRALKEAGFHEAPGGQRYTSAAASSSERESDWLKSQLQTIQTHADVEVLSRPRVRSLLGQTAEVQVSCASPQIAYLVRTGNKTFESREAAAQPALGMTISLTAQADVENPGQIEISPLKISTTTFDGRESVPGLDLDVGKPIISTRRLETSIRMSDGGEASGIVLPGPSGRHAVLFLCVRRVAKAAAQSQPKPVEPPATPPASPNPNP